MSTYGWTGKRARHKDGREGVIREYVGWHWIILRIEKNGEVIGFVNREATRNYFGDRVWKWHGERGWQYLYVDYDGSELWVDLGEFD